MLSQQYVNQQIQEFESVLDLLATKDQLSISKKDLQLLAEIQQKLNNLPKASQKSLPVDLEDKQKDKKIKLEGKNREKENIGVEEPINSAPRSALKEPERIRSVSDTTALKNQLKSENQTKPEKSDSVSTEEGARGCGRIGEKVLNSINYFSNMILEKADFYSRLRLAALNSAISIKTADYFVNHFSRILYGATGSCFVHKPKVGTPSSKGGRGRGIDVYGQVEPNQVKHLQNNHKANSLYR